jgi:malonyl CoA-acyl carrier protein transacylase
MATKATSNLFLPAFGGQGTGIFDTRNAQYQRSNLATSPSAVTLLTACHAALHTELASLSLETSENVDICASDFADNHSILDPTNERLIDNPAFCGPRLFLIQALLYLSFIENSSVRVPGSLTPFADALRSNLSHAIGILGFSFGIISACVVAASATLHSFICYAVEAYRLAFWIGIRSQLYRMAVSSWPTRSHDLRPWSLVLLGMDKLDIRNAVDRFNKVFLF